MKLYDSRFNTKRVTPVFFLAVILVFSLAGCAALGNSVPYPSASINDVSITGVTFTSLKIRFDVAIKNPYGTALPVAGMEYKLSSNGKRFLEGAIENSHMIPAGESLVIPMPVSVPFVELYEVGASVKPGSSFPYRADLGLMVDAPIVGSIKLPLDAEGTFTIPSLP